MTRQIKHILTGNILYIVAIAATFLLFPGASIWPTAIALIGIWAMIAYIYKLSGSTNLCGWWTLLISATYLAVGIIANVNHYTSIVSSNTSIPYLQNPDSAIYYFDAMKTFDSSIGASAPAHRHGYGMLIAALWHLTDMTIVSPLIVNMTFILLSIIASGIIARRILSAHIGKDSRWITSCAMIMTAAVCYYLNSGTLLLKEAGICFALAVCTLGATALISQPSNKAKTVTLWVGLIVGLALLTFLRHSYILFVATAIIVMTPWKRNKIAPALSMLLLCAAAWGVTQLLMHDYEISRQAANIVNGNGVANSYFHDHPQHATYNNMVGDYFSYTVAQRLLWLPISIITQFLTPFPWNFGRDLIYGYTLDYAHITYPWYIVGAMVLFYIIWAWRKSPKSLIRITLAGIILWCIPAYLFAGTVSRYALPMLPLLVPAAVYVWAQFSTKRSFHIYGGIYAIVLCVTLIICHNLQHLGMQ
ncbi:MAG: hypothetical protein IKZ14_03975 [Muribaculaceae bacterium]|nr:hypothetical protein [Muribaculaceae bacterium]